jgi:hypothetical protein
MIKTEGLKVSVLLRKLAEYELLLQKSIHNE